MPPGTTWWLEADRETWLLVLSGVARVSSFDILTGDAVFAQSDRVNVHVGPDALVGLVAYTGLGGPVAHLLQRIATPSPKDSKLAATPQKAPSDTSATTGRGYRSEESIR